MNVNSYSQKKLHICERLKNARKEAGYKSARSFALKYGINPRTYQQHEAGETEVRLSSLVNYGRLLNKSYLWLIVGLEKYKNLPFSDAEIEETGCLFE